MQDLRGLRRIRVLLVDCQLESAQAIHRLLRYVPDIQIVGLAVSARAAIELARQLQPDVVLLDDNLPDQDGLLVAEVLLRQLQTHVVVMSVRGDAVDLTRAVALGVTGYLIRPFGADELVGALRQACGRHHPAPQPAQWWARPTGCVVGPTDWGFEPGQAQEALLQRAREAQERAREAHERAEGLLRDVIGEEAYQRLQCDGYLEVSSPHHRRRVYRIPRAGGPATVVTRYRTGDHIGKRRLCVVPAETGLPAADRVLIHKLLIEGDEERYLRTAHRI